MQKLSDERLEEIRRWQTKQRRFADDAVTLAVNELLAEVDRLRALAIPPEPGEEMVVGQDIGDLLDQPITVDEAIGCAKAWRDEATRLAAQIRALTDRAIAAEADARRVRGETDVDSLEASLWQRALAAESERDHLRAALQEAAKLADCYCGETVRRQKLCAKIGCGNDIAARIRTLADATPGEGET